MIKRKAGKLHEERERERFMKMVASVEPIPTHVIFNIKREEIIKTYTDRVITNVKIKTCNPFDLFQ